jgi:hypothetical protein
MAGDGEGFAHDQRHWLRTLLPKRVRYLKQWLPKRDVQSVVITIVTQTAQTID